MIIECYASIVSCPARGPGTRRLGRESGYETNASNWMLSRGNKSISRRTDCFVTIKGISNAFYGNYIDFD
jgi:hypothetical protein